MKHFSKISEAIADLHKGKMLIVVDDPQRENEGDFFMPVDTVTSRHVALMIKEGSGLLCTAITGQQRRRLQLPLMVPRSKNTEKTKVNFTISVNAAKGITTGVSAHDRTKTIKTLGDPSTQPQDLARPGHVFGLVAEQGGILKRAGHTEAAVTLAKFAGFTPAGVLCEIVGPDGRMANYSGLAKLAKKLRLKIITIRDLMTYVKQQNLG
ncbi:MAG: 3,4-dihydroxy-2-butanone-4-phosphate synthase [Candidatus Doudnabacteria bacterium]|nr:3,4-dihydroxy-2-butanone-4-phosphate synthase [Candidatus Doudnabacteria bacterium]